MQSLGRHFSEVFEPLADQGESGEAKTFDMLALLPGCKTYDNYWRGRAWWIR